MEKELEKDIKVKIIGVDIDGVLRGKYISKDKFLSAVKSDGFGFCSVIFGWDMHDKGYSASAFSNAGNGFQDLVAKIDLKSFRRSSYDNNVATFFIYFFDPVSMKALSVCPRSLLKSVTERTSYKAMAGVELEWFNFQESPQTLQQKNFMNLTPLTAGMHGYSMLKPQEHIHFFDDIYDHAYKSGIEIEGFHTETGDGVYEVGLKFGSAIDLADKGLLFKNLVKVLGMQQPMLHPGTQSVQPTFMAKPHQNLPGCSGHLHLSLMDKDGKNTFYDKDDPHNMSQTFKYFLAGLIKCLPYVMPMYAPTINSYKRLVANMWSPIKNCWGFENRTAAVRVITPATSGIGCSASGTRCEMRVPGADINVHLALAACFASGLYGIEQKLELPEPLLGDVMANDKIETLPKSLREASLKMQGKDSLARVLFGDEFVDHFTGTRMNECLQYEQAVTQWELKRYFELV